ncbi:MAG TPA: hypothetical protein VLS93_14500 [Anaeromyxobacteraceae bacterium]|nr:hypothetical protein [Anaeromyxobacteraceae bacterium]
MRATLFALAVALLPAAAAAEPGRLTVTGGLGAGGELGLDTGEAGVVEVEAAVGWEFQPSRIRPELSVAIGFQPDGHVAFRPGIRWTLPGLPIQLRAAVDAANSRGDMRWRWVLVGAAVELRVTDAFGLFAAFDTGVPLSAESGVPVLGRAGGSFRF